MCTPKPPKPDPLIGQAAMSNADLSKEMAGVAREQLAWEKERADRQDPLVEQIVNQQISQGDTNQARADEQWNIYKNMFEPVESQMVSDAMGFDSQERKDRMAGQAAAGVTQSYANTNDQNDRNMERMGINPNSGRFAALRNETGMNQAKDTAGAMNKARTDTELQGIALRTGAAQFGRNMPNTGIAADSLALNAGNAAVGNMNTSNAARNASMNSAAQWFGGAVGGNNSAGGLANAQYGNQLNAWNSQNQNSIMGMMGLGQLAGAAGPSIMSAGKALLPMLALRKGGMIRGGHAYRFRPRFGGGLSSLRRRGYAEGGMIEGPGTGTSDSIPASIEGGQPIKLSDGEAVLNAEAVNLVGEDFIHRINSGGLSMLHGDDAEENNQYTRGA